MTLTIIFGGKRASGKHGSGYSRVRKPIWVSDKMLKDMIKSKDYDQKWADGGAYGRDQIKNTKFPMFVRRIRKLGHFIDTRKPKLLRQLWKDKRDTLNYYTFWAITLFVT
jgi:hypothetical protein